MGLASKLGPAAPSAPPAPGAAPAGGQYGAPPPQGGGMQAPRPGAPLGQQPGQFGQPGHPGQQPGQFGQQPGQLGQQPGQFGQQPGQFGQAPGQFGQQPGQFGQQQGQYGQPGQAKQQPGQFGQQPGQFGQQPGQFGQQPGQFGQQPGQFGQQPGQYGQQPGQFGQQPGQPAAFGGAPGASLGPSPPGAAFDHNTIRQKLQQLVMENRLQAFYPPQKIEQVVQFVSSRDVAGLGTRWRLPREVTLDLIGLALYDIVIYVDDSGSMAFEEGGERIDDMKAVLGRTADAATLFDTDGIVVSPIDLKKYETVAHPSQPEMKALEINQKRQSLLAKHAQASFTAIAVQLEPGYAHRRFMNGTVEGNGIRSEAEAAALIQQVKFSGTTPLGSNLDRKVLQPMVLSQARSGSMQKPVLVICITDGEPTGEPKEAVRQVVMNAKNQLQSSPYGPGAVAFQFAQVGKDAGATRFLSALDTDPVIGSMIDCTSYYEQEQEEYARKGINLDPSLYLVKLMVGGIDRSYDEGDEG